MLKKINAIASIKKNVELRNYVLWGVISAILNVGVFQFLIFAGVDYKISNIMASILIKIFCYVTNKIFVFHIKCENCTALFKEVLSFFMARIVTFGIDYFGIILLVELIGLNIFISKLVMVVVVVIANYLFNKLFVFKKKYV